MRTRLRGTETDVEGLPRGEIWFLVTLYTSAFPLEHRLAAASIRCQLTICREMRAFEMIKSRQESHERLGIIVSRLLPALHG